MVYDFPSGWVKAGAAGLFFSELGEFALEGGVPVLSACVTERVGGFGGRELCSKCVCVAGAADDLIPLCGRCSGVVCSAFRRVRELPRCECLCALLVDECARSSELLSQSLASGASSCRVQLVL